MGIDRSTSGLARLLNPLLTFCFRFGASLELESESEDCLFRFLLVFRGASSESEEEEDDDDSEDDACTKRECLASSRAQRGWKQKPRTNDEPMHPRYGIQRLLCPKPGLAKATTKATTRDQ